MRVLVTGYSGQLGYDVVKKLNKLNIDNIGVKTADFDLTDKDKTKEFVRNYAPSVVVHCAAYTAVDKAEDEKDRSYAVNVLGTQYLVEVCKELEIKLIYISTDYVFDGKGNLPFDINDKPNPQNQYGMTKFMGEQVVQTNLEKYFIVRVSWIYGKNGNNFVKTMLRLGKQCDEINVVCDQIGSPTCTCDLAILIAEMIKSDKYGVYHATNEGYCSWYDFAKKIFSLAGYSTKVNPITTEEYPTKAIRPINSKLSKDSLDKNGFNRLPSWEVSLSKFLELIL